jgi:hypothetical protein
MSQNKERKEVEYGRIERENMGGQKQNRERKRMEGRGRIERKKTGTSGVKQNKERKQNTKKKQNQFLFHMVS